MPPDHVCMTAEWFLGVMFFFYRYQRGGSMMPPVEKHYFESYSKFHENNEKIKNL